MPKIFRKNKVKSAVFNYRVSNLCYYLPPEYIVHTYILYYYLIYQYLLKNGVIYNNLYKFKL